MTRDEERREIARIKQEWKRVAPEALDGSSMTVTESYRKCRIRIPAVVVDGYSRVSAARSLLRRALALVQLAGLVAREAAVAESRRKRRGGPRVRGRAVRR